MQRQTGRMLRNMSFTRMIKIESGFWQPAVDVYESGEKIVLYFDLAGVVKESLDLLVEEHQVHIRGSRQLAQPRAIACIHHLEIEQGSFARMVELPALIEVKDSSSSYVDGILVVSLRKKKAQNQITIRVQVGG